MKNLISILLPASIALMAFTYAPKTDAGSTSTSDNDINWVTLEEAVELNAKNPKKIFIDFYTDWCGWCKKMDASTFSNDKIIRKMNEDFYAVKFDAETEETVTFNGKDYEFVPYGRKGANRLAIELASRNGRLGYPTVVVLDSDLSKLQTFPGYKDVNGMSRILSYYGDGHYQTKNWQEFMQETNP